MSVAEIIVASIAGLAPVGGGVAFVWNKIEARFGKIESALEKCEERDRQGMERRGVQLTVIEMMWRELERLDPGSQVLVRARHLLDGLKVRLAEQRLEVSSERTGGHDG